MSSLIVIKLMYSKFSDNVLDGILFFSVVDVPTLDLGTILYLFKKNHGFKKNTRLKKNINSKAPRI